MCAPKRKRLKAPAGDPLEPQVQDEGSTAQAGNTLFHGLDEKRADLAATSERTSQFVIRIGRAHARREANYPVSGKLAELFPEKAEYLHIEVDVPAFERAVNFGLGPRGSEVAPSIDDVQVGALANPDRP